MFSILILYNDISNEVQGYNCAKNKIATMIYQN